VATVTLLGEELAHADLPRVCIQCGSRRRVDFVERTFVWRPWFSPWMLLRLIPYRRLTAYVPLCEAHGGFRWLAHRSGQWWGLRPLGIADDRMTLAGVSEEFVAALREHREGVGDDEGPLMDALPAGAPLSHRRPPRRYREPPPVNDPTWIVPLVLLGVPLLGCAGMCLVGAVANALNPRPSPAPAPAPPTWPAAPAAPAEAAPGIPARPEVVGLLAVDPAAGAPGGVPWTALLLSCRAEPLHFLDDAEWNKALQELKPGDLGAADAAKRLAEAVPTEQRRPATVQALRPLLTDRWPEIREAAARALGVWGTVEDAPALAALLNDPFPNVQDAALDGLAGLKDPACAPAVAQRMTSPRDRDKAAAVLEAIGPAAEPSVLPFLTNRDPRVRAAACRILKAVGSKDSLDSLRVAAHDRDPTVAAAASEAVKAVTDRPQGKQP
jgi:HEAT repeat protein